MKGMKSAQEFYQPPTPGRYLSRIDGAEPQISKAGASMIKLSLTIVDPNFPKYQGEQCDDYVITAGDAKGGGLGKQKLRGLGVFEMFGEIDDDVPDNVIAQRLLGTQIYVEFGNEQKNSKDAAGNYSIPMTAIDGNGNEVKLMKLIVKGFVRHSVGGAVAQAPAQLQAPQGYAQPAPVQQYAQPQMAAPQGYAQPQQVYAQAPQQAPVQYAPAQQLQGQPQYAQGFAPQAPQGQPTQQFAPMTAAPPWSNGGVAIPQQAAAEAPKKVRKMKVDGGAEG